MAEILRWDMCPEPTELLLTGCFKETIQNQKYKSKMLTPRTKLLTCDVLLHPLQWVFFQIQTENRAACQEHVATSSENSNIQWKFTDSKTKTNDSGESETNQHGFVQPVECEGKSFTKLGMSGRTGECRWRTRWSNERKEICARPHKSRILTSEKTGKSLHFKFLETRQQRSIFALYWHKKSCANNDPKDWIWKHEVHKPSIHNEGLPFRTK